jgi:hypothetical protein
VLPALGLALWLASPRPAGPGVSVEPTAFRVRDPDRDLVWGVGPSLGTKLFTIGSPNPAQWAPELGLRATLGSLRYSLFLAGAAGPILPLRGSIAQTQRGSFLEGLVAVRLMPVQHRLFRLGGWVGIAFDEIRVLVRLAESAGGASGEKRVGHVSPEIGMEMAWPVVLPRASRRWHLDLYLGHALRLSLATRSTLRVEDEQGTTSTEHLAPELRVMGPFSGAMISGRAGLTFHHELPRPRRRPR